MSNTLMADTKNGNRSLIVEQIEDDYITVKKKLKNTEYAVEMLVFKKEDIDELSIIQKELYATSTEKNALLERLSRILKKIGRQK